MTNVEQSATLPDLTDPNLAAALIRYRRVFLSFLVRRVGNSADAEDVLQTFSLNVLERSDGLRAVEDKGLLAWLYAVLRSTLTDYFRTEQRMRRKNNAFAVELAATPEGGGTELLQSDFCECLRSLLPLLKPDQADVLRRVDFELQNRASVAGDLGITSGALSVRLHRARIAIRNLLLTSCFSCPTHGWDDCACDPGKMEKLALLEAA